MKHIRNKMKARKGIFHFMEEQRKAEIEKKKNMHYKTDTIIMFVQSYYC